MATGKPPIKWTGQYTDHNTGMTYEVAFEMNVESIAQFLAARCIKGKSGKAQALHGDIKAVLLKPGKGS